MLGILRTYLFAHTTNRIDVELGARLFRHLLALPMAYFQARRVGDSVARVRELENIRNFLTSSALTLVIDLFFTFVFLGVMFFYSPLLTWIVLGSFPFYIAISAGATPLFRRRLDEKFQRGAENQAFLVESVTGIETLKAMAVEPQMQRRWEEQLAGYVAASFRVLSLGNTASQAVQLVSKIVTAGILYCGARLVIDGSLSVGELVAFNILAGRVSAPVLRLAQIWQDFHQARLSIARLGDILNTTAEPTYSAGRARLPAIRGDIKFDHVSFRYRIDGQEVLHDVSFEVPAGQTVGIVGPSGSGKSTFAKLVQRLYVPERGRVLVDGMDLAMADPAWLRRQIGVVLQENVLFNRSVRDNIALADPAMPMERVIAAARLAGAHEFILELTEGYDTVVGERGSTLSGGQRQRIAIARALVTDPRILIFDEATSALDYESERIIQQNMKDIAKGRTVLVIAHRLSTVRAADRIVTLDRGRLVEDGSHDTLIKTGGRYASLHRLQGGSMKSSEAACRAAPRHASSRSGARKQRRGEELAFLPAALEIVETPPSPIGRAIGAAIIVLFCAALVWAWWGTIDIVASATGKILPSGRTKVDPAVRDRGGARRSGCRTGRAVKAGDVLIELDPTVNEAERDHLRNDLLAERLNIARLRAALAGGDDPVADFMPPADADPELIATQRQLLLNQVTEHRAKIAALAPPAGAEGSRARHDRGDDPQARDHHSGDPVARRHPQDAGGEGAGLEAQLFRGDPAPGRAARGVQRPEEPSAGDRGGDRRDPRDARPGGGGISAHALRRTRQGRAEGERARAGPDQGRAADQASATDARRWTAWCSSSRSTPSAAWSRRRSPCWWWCRATAGWRSRPWCRTATSASSTPGRTPRSRSIPSISPATACCTARCFRSRRTP